MNTNAKVHRDSRKKLESLLVALRQTAQQLAIEGRHEAASQTWDATARIEHAVRHYGATTPVEERTND